MESRSAHHSVRRAVGLHGVEVYGHVGFFPEERKMGRLFRIDVHAEYISPEVGQVPPVDYREIAAMVKEAFSTEGVLIEHIAERLALQILTRWEAVEKVQIRVSKVHPPVGILAQDAYAEVEMVRMATP